MDNNQDVNHPTSETNNTTSLPAGDPQNTTPEGANSSVPSTTNQPTNGTAEGTTSHSEETEERAEEAQNDNKEILGARNPIQGGKGNLGNTHIPLQ